MTFQQSCLRLCYQLLKKCHNTLKSDNKSPTTINHFIWSSSFHSHDHPTCIIFYPQHPSSLSVYKLLRDRARVSLNLQQDLLDEPTDQVFNKGTAFLPLLWNRCASSTGHCVSHLCHVISHLPARLGNGYYYYYAPVLGA